MPTTTFCYNAGFTHVVRDGHIHLVATVDGSAAYWIDGVQHQPPAGKINSIAIAQDSNGIAVTWSDGRDVNFRWSAGDGTWAATVPLWTAPQGYRIVQPNIAVTPDSAEVVWHLVANGAPEDENGEVWHAGAFLEVDWLAYKMAVGKYPSVDPVGYNTVYRTKGSDGVWKSYANGSATPLATGLDLSVNRGAIAYQRTSDVYFKNIAGNGAEVLAAKTGLFPRAAGSGNRLVIAYEKLAKKGGSTDNANKRCGLAVSTDAGKTWKDVSPEQKGLVQGMVDPLGTIWAAIDLTGKVVTGTVPA